ncbi:hypothetical protein DXG01_013108 [Tephrocybe rancida]|nr:hypothetical protein DXG01_013108 [Tephrocybe rancida]
MQSNQSHGDTTNSDVLGAYIAKSMTFISISTLTLDALQVGFTFPDTIDIIDGGPHRKAFDFLSPTRNNEHLLRYIADITELRSDVKAIESFKNSDVRKARRYAVDRAEEALQKVADKIEKSVYQMRALLIRAAEFCGNQSDGKHNRFTTHKASSLPEPPLPSHSVCRRVGKESEFADFTKAFKAMAKKTTDVQLARLKAMSLGRTTIAWDKDLTLLSKAWNRQVDRLAIRSVAAQTQTAPIR